MAAANEAGAGLAYWRTLAIERQRQIEELRARLLAAIDVIPDAHFRVFVSALETSRVAWVREIDAMPASPDLEDSHVIDVLDDLWRRVAADQASSRRL